MINFDPKEHRYTDEQGQEYISVSKLLEKEFPFDREAIANKVRKYPRSKYFGMPKKEILAEWQRAADIGTELHGAIELWIKEGKEPLDPCLWKMVGKFSSIDFLGKLSAEVRVWHTPLQIAGTVDILVECKNTTKGKTIDGYDTLNVTPHMFKVWDIKTSKRMNEANLRKYSAQMEIYRRLVEKTFHAPAEIGGILWYAQYAEKREDTELHTVIPEPCEEFVDKLFADRWEQIRGRKREHATTGSHEEPQHVSTTKQSPSKGTVSRRPKVSKKGSGQVLDQEPDGEEALS